MFGAGYDELGQKFPRFVDVLAEISEQTSVNSQQSVVALYERWVRTRSGWMERRLRAHGVLAYASALATKVDRRIPLDSGSDEEIEIRALSVVAVDELVARLRNHGLDWDAARVDEQLWWRSQTHRERDLPYHRTRTIWY